MEKQIDELGDNGPEQTRGRREWLARFAIRDRKIARSKKSDSAHTIDIETVREYTDTLYGRPDEVDLEIVDRIPQVAHDIDELPTPDEIARAVHKVKSRRVRTDIPAEAWKALYFNEECKGVRAALNDLIIEQYQAYMPSTTMSTVRAKILDKPGKKKSKAMKDKRIIVVQPFCTCVMEVLCRDRLEEICNKHINDYLFQYGFTKNKGTQEALFVHRSYVKQRRESGLDTFILNLDVVKAFDKMDPQIINKLLLRIGAPPTLVNAIMHIYSTRKMEFKIKGKTLEVTATENRTLLMQGGALGPTIYKCLKLGVWLSLDKDKVWPNQNIYIANDFSHKLKGHNRGLGLINYQYIQMFMIIFADDMQLYFDSRAQLVEGAKIFIEHLRLWGLKVHVAPQIDDKSKSKVMLCPAVNRIEITNEGDIVRRDRPQGSQLPLEVPGGFILFVDSYKFLGSIWTSDTSMKPEIANRKAKFLVKLHLYKDMLQSRHVSMHLKKQIVRVCLDEILFYSSESMNLTESETRLYESARLYVFRTMRRITRYDQHTYHIKGKDMQRELKMASAHEKIMRRHFKFVAKIIKKSPSLSPERMMMGSPKLIWQRDVFEVELKPDRWNPAHGKTTARYLEDRAIQLYYHVYVKKEDTDLGDPKAIIRALLSFQGTQAEMIQQSTWMEMIIGSFELWERVVIYGQFQPIDAGETDQERRKRRNNTFAKQPTEYIQEIGSKGQLLRIIRHRVKE